MLRPVCCGKSATPYHKDYRLDTRPSWEEGWRCKRCGRFRIPDGRPFDPAYMNSLDAVREAGILFDETLSSNVNTVQAARGPHLNEPE